MRLPVPPLGGAVPDLQYGDRDRGETSPVSRSYRQYLIRILRVWPNRPLKTKTPPALAGGALCGLGLFGL